MISHFVRVCMSCEPKMCGMSLIHKEFIIHAELSKDLIFIVKIVQISTCADVQQIKNIKTASPHKLAFLQTGTAAVVYHIVELTKKSFVVVLG